MSLPTLLLLPPSLLCPLTTIRFDAWVRTVDAYAGGDLLWLNPTGKIPEEAIIQLGVKRAQPFRERKRFDATSFPETGREKMADVADEEDAEADDEVKLNKAQMEELEG